MPQPTISLCMIAFNEEANLPRCLATALPYVDELVVADTGSVDGTVAVAEGLGAKIVRYDRTTNPESFFRDDESTGIPGSYTGLWTLADFAGARNASFAPATKDFVLWLDADDVLHEGAALRDVVAEMNRDAQDAGWFAYESGPRRWWRERLMRRSAAPPWSGEVHETMFGMPSGRWRKFERPIVRHMASEARKQARIQHRNLKLLARVAARAGDNADPRTLFYLGNEARYVVAEKAIEAYERYLRKSAWREERVVARFRMGAVYERKEDYEMSYRHYAAAALDEPGFPNAWFGLARIAYYREDWTRCAEWTAAGLSIKPAEAMVPLDNLDAFVTPHVYYNRALWNLGRREEAARSCAAGLAAEPWNAHLKQNTDFYSRQLGVPRKAPAPLERPETRRTRILVKYPTRSRPEKFFSTLGLWKGGLSGKHDVRFAVTIDEDDATMNNDAVLTRAHMEGCEVTASSSKTKVEACNAGVSGEFDILMLISDDMIPQAAGWDDVVARDMAAHFPAKDGALHYDDGFTGERLCTLSVMGERLYRQFGYIYNPEYRSLWCDNEYTEVARGIGKHAYVPRVLARHEHIANVGGAADPLQARNDALYWADKEIYERRKARGFDMVRPELSVLVPSLVARAPLLAELMACVRPQLDRLQNPWSVEIRVAVDDGAETVGAKRNRLLREARGRYVSFVDDDDLLSPTYLDDILAACRAPDGTGTGPDCVVFNGIMTTAGVSPKPFLFSRDYLRDSNHDEAYLRIPNHLCAVRAEIAKSIPFQEMNVGEDAAWARELLPRLATETKIPKTLYFYRWQPGSVSWVAAQKSA